MQTNGQAESANKIVLKGIKKSLEAAKGAWVDDLPRVVWSARITTTEATGHSPFGLVYGSKAVLLVVVGIPSPQMNFYEFDKNEEEKPINFDLLPETRGNALLQSIRYKQRVTQQFNRRVKATPIRLGGWGCAKSRGNEAFTPERKAGCKLGWPLQSDGSHQARHISTGKLWRNTLVPAVERW